MGTKSAPVLAERWRLQKAAKQQARAARKAVGEVIKRAIAKQHQVAAEAERHIRNDKRVAKSKRKEVRDMVRKEALPFLRVAGALTNWQRHRWAKAGYPGLMKKDVAGVQPFLDQKRPGTRKERVSLVVELLADRVAG